MPTLGSLIIDIAANTSQLKTDLAGARKEVSTFAGNVEGGFSSVTRLGTGLLKLGAGIFTLEALGEAAKSVFEHTADAERQFLRLNAVLRATGHESGATAAELKELADSLSKNSLFDDKQILAAISQLETFDNVSGTTLKKAIGLSVDLASLWDGDVSSAAFALGKALQDPAEAAALLSRAHVRLTDEEKKSIDSFVRLGDTASAQAVILKALQDRVGGVAGDEASGLSGAFHRVKVAIDDAQKSLGKFLLGSKGETEGMATAIERALGKGAGLIPLRPDKPLEDTGINLSRQLLDKQLQDRLTLLTGHQASGADIAAVREQAQADAEALKLPNLALEDRARITKELLTIQGAFAQAQAKEIEQQKKWAAWLEASHQAALELNGELSRMAFATDSAIRKDLVESLDKAAKTKADVAKEMQDAIDQSGFSQDVETMRNAPAKLFEETWKNAVRGAQESLAQFFMDIGKNGEGLIGLLKDIGQQVKAMLAQIAAQSVGNALFPTLFKGIAGAAGGGIPSAPNVGNIGDSLNFSRGAAPSAIHVMQNITFAPQLIDGPSGDQWLRARGGTIAGVMADAVTAAPGLARHIVAQAGRG